jgi:hypothetical protein
VVARVPVANRIRASRSRQLSPDAIFMIGGGVGLPAQRRLPDRKASLADALLPLLRVADQAEPGRDDLVRLAATALREALIHLAELIGERLNIEDRSPDGAIRAFAELHLKS